MEIGHPNQDAVRKKNLLDALQRTDPKILEIMDHQKFGVLYVMMPDQLQPKWEDGNKSGAVYLVRRSEEPYYQVLLKNTNQNQEGQDLVDNVYPEWDIDSQENYIFYRICNMKENIRGLWFKEDNERITFLASLKNAHAELVAQRDKKKNRAGVDTALPIPSKKDMPPIPGMPSAYPAYPHSHPHNGAVHNGAQLPHNGAHGSSSLPHNGALPYNGGGPLPYSGALPSNGAIPLSNGAVGTRPSGERTAGAEKQPEDVSELYNLFGITPSSGIEAPLPRQQLQGAQNGQMYMQDTKGMKVDRGGQTMTIRKRDFPRLITLALQHLLQKYAQDDKMIDLIWNQAQNELGK